MAAGAPRATKAPTQNPVENPLYGGIMGGGCQGKKGDVQYAHAVPPSWNGGAMNVFVQRAYFSAWSMVFDLPSVMSSSRVLPWGESGLLCPPIRALLA